MDLEMPASGGINDRRVERAVRAGALEAGALDAVVVRGACLLRVRVRVGVGVRVRVGLDLIAEGPPDYRRVRPVACHKIL